MSAPVLDDEEHKPSVATRFKQFSLMDQVLGHIPGVRSFFDLKDQEYNLEPRRLYNNLPLPDTALDPKTGFPTAKYATNKIRTTKYTPLNFLPKNVLFQFKNIANIYFLAVAILSGFKIFGVDNPGLAAVPIIAIVIVTAIRDGIEDSRRQILDGDLNNSVVYRLNHANNPNVVLVDVSAWRKFKKACSRFYRTSWYFITRRKRKSHPIVDEVRPSVDIRPSMDTNARPSNVGDHSRPSMGDSRAVFKTDYWKNIQVGDFIKLYANDSVPSDVLVVSSSESDGSCFIETRNLDGETNLKPRQAAHITEHIRHARQCAQEQFVVDVEGANPNLNSWGWTIQKPDQEPEALGTNNFIPRGSTVRNTKWVIGYVVYTGFESKIMLNAGQTPTKRSRLTRELNFYMYISFLFIFLLSLVGGVVEGVKFRNKRSTIYYFEFGLVAGNPAMNGFVNFWATLILLQNLIPISLFISIEIVRTIQAFFIWSDVQIYDEETNYPCTPKTWSISDELGQIEFIFSDKTGTLTQNSMVFRKCSVNGKTYGIALADHGPSGQPLSSEEKSQQQAEVTAEEERMMTVMEKYYKNPFIGAGDLQLLSAAIYSDLLGDSGNQQQQSLHLFALGLALCNTVITDNTDGNLVHKSESPDEATMVSTARDLGYTLTNAEKDVKSVVVRGEQQDYEVLGTVMFTSARKRMSVLLKDAKGRSFVLTKGADNVILPRLVDPNSEVVEATMADLQRYANEGLRTLLFCYKEVDTQWALGWRDRFIKAAASPDREALTAQVADELETGLTLIGGTGVEDQLQEGVPDTIKTLGEAGIKIWVLTGDKLETAIAIGYTCNLLTPEMELLVALGPEKVTEYLNVFGLSGTQEEVNQLALDHSPVPPTHALVIDGETIAKISESQTLTRHFALVGKKCRSVICCRVSPAQKAVVVDIVKSTFDVTTLAVGDGANDVSMIQKADVGVGIVGVEGRQAAMSSDYAIGKFRFLQRLILVHGHWSYMRIAELTANLLYKNVVFTMTLFWYGIHNNFDNSYVFDYTYITLFNSVFTSLPVVFMGCLDQDIPDNVALGIPALYAKGILRREWTRSKFFIYITDGLYQSAVAYFFAYSCFYNGGFVSRAGTQINYRTAYGVFIATVAILSCNLFVLINTHRWDWLFGFIVILSCGLLFAWTGIYTSFVTSADFYKAGVEVYQSVSFWAMVLLGTITALLPRLCYLTVQKVLFPTDIDIAREMYLTGKLHIAPTSPVSEKGSDLTSNLNSSSKSPNVDAVSTSAPHLDN